MEVQKFDRKNISFAMDSLYVQPKGPVACLEVMTGRDGYITVELTPRAGQADVLEKKIAELGGRFTLKSGHADFISTANPQEIAFLNMVIPENNGDYRHHH